ncbi:metallophosphoesterase family protein [Bradyrhizobium sp.]|jgi:serine/threonine protein phosphatase 1|uniref:metallophosphoesterase family protein n=1 Tax=Bradyrhizobium sp. TaxID=376 RepID=UPI003C1701A2
MLGFLKSRRSTKKPHLPEGTRIYALGDIHGRADLLKKMFTVIDADLARNPASRPIQVFLGDYVDRGPDSAGTLDLLIERGRHHETVCLKGNHEAFMLEVLHDPNKLGEWRKFGGLQTLMAYGLQPSLNPGAEEQVELIQALTKRMPDTHLRFLEGLLPSFLCGDFFFVHAGVRPGVPLKEQTEADMLWIRDEFLNSEENFGKFIVHGHTPVREPDIRPNRINIDTGAYATGNLTLLTIQGDSMLAL